MKIGEYVGEALAASVLAAGGPKLSHNLMRTEKRLQEVAESHGDELARHADRLVVTAGAVTCGGVASRLVGLCALTLDQPDDAVGWLRKAVASNRRIGAAPFVARAQAELATAPAGPARRLGGGLAAAGQGGQGGYGAGDGRAGPHYRRAAGRRRRGGS